MTLKNQRKLMIIREENCIYIQNPFLLLIRVIFSMSEKQKLFPVMKPVQARAQKQPRLLPQALNSVSYI